MIYYQENWLCLRKDGVRERRIEIYDDGAKVG